MINQNKIKTLAVPFSLGLFLALILILSLALLQTRQKKLLQSRAASESQTSLNLIVKLVRNPVDAAISLAKVSAVKGPLPQHPSTSLDQTATHELEELIDGKVIDSVKIHFAEHIFSLPPKPGSPQKFGDAPVKLPTPQAVVEIAYLPKAQLQVRDLATNVLQQLPQSQIDLAVSLAKEPKNKGKVFPEKVATLDGHFDIVYVSSHYSDFNQFTNDVASLSAFLLTIPPYSELIDKITTSQINNQDDLGCNYIDGRVIECDDMLVHEAASAANHDTIVVVENNPVYGGGAVLGDYAVSYNDVNAWARQVAFHEMGHSVGRLYDEYDTGETWSSTTPPPYDNCSLYPCKWERKYKNVGCFLVCGFEDLYRPSQNDCVMRTLTPDTGFHFDPVDEETMRSVISADSATKNFDAEIAPVGDGPDESHVPATMSANISYKVIILAKNTGKRNWTKEKSVVLGWRSAATAYLFGQASQFHELKPTDVIRSSESKRFRFEVIAPSQPGTYRLVWQMARNPLNVRWFGNKLVVEVRVKNP